MSILGRTAALALACTLLNACGSPQNQMQLLNDHVSQMDEGMAGCQPLKSQQTAVAFMECFISVQDEWRSDIGFEYTDLAVAYDARLRALASDYQKGKIDHLGAKKEMAAATESFSSSVIRRDAAKQADYRRQQRGALMALAARNAGNTDTGEPLYNNAANFNPSYNSTPSQNLQTNIDFGGTVANTARPPVGQTFYDCGQTGTCAGAFGTGR